MSRHILQRFPRVLLALVAGLTICVAAATPRLVGVPKIAVWAAGGTGHQRALRLQRAMPFFMFEIRR